MRLKFIPWAAPLLIFALLVASAGRVSAAPTILYAGADATEVYIEGSGFTSPVKVSLLGTNLPIISAKPTIIFAKLSFPLTHGTYSLVLTFGSTTITTTLSLSGVISGAISSSGTVQFGHGFTAKRTAKGTYVLTFPANSFTTDTVPTPIVQPVDGMLVSESMSETALGGATLNIKFAADTTFTFMIANSL